MGRTVAMIPPSFTMSMLFATIAVVMMSFMFSVHVARAQSTGTDDTAVTSSNNSPESTGTNNTTVTSSNNSPESTGTDSTTLTSSNNSPESTGTDNTTVTSSNNFPESTGTDSTTVTFSNNSPESTGTNNTTVTSSNNSPESTGTDSTTVTFSNNSPESTGTDSTTVTFSNNSPESTGTDSTTVASSNNSPESTGNDDTTVAYSNSISESTATDGTALFSTSEITSTDYTTVASSCNSPESTGSDSTTFYIATEITSTDDTTLESTDFHSTTETPENNSANDATPTGSTGHTDGSTETTEIPFGQSCSSSGMCPSSLTCNSGMSCVCQDDYYFNNTAKSCLQKKTQGVNCSSIKECASNLSCVSSKCDCDGGFYYDNSSHSCLTKKTQGVNCSSIKECASNLSCVSSKCDCDGGFYYDNSSHSCLTKKTQGVNCSSIEECASNLSCVSSKCDCDGGFYYDNSSHSCLTKKTQGTNCSSIKECVSNLSCVSSKCDCDGGFYYDNSSHSCLTKKTQGVNCSSIKECASNLSCVSSKCDCDGGFYYDNSSHSCLTKLDHGAVCRSSLECKLSNTVCTSYLPSSPNKCLCDGDFYWASNSSCISRNILKITARASKIETRTVIFEWSDMSNNINVTYNIKWNDSNNINANRTGVTVTGLEPGTYYNFSVVTSLPADGNYPLISVEQPQVPLWTRPDRPGPVSEVRHEANSTYAITFGQSNGNVSLYTMNVLSEKSVIETQSSTSTLMHFTKLKPATTYIYVLESYNGNSEKSDPTTGNFTTGPEASGPVIGFSYREILSHTANVTWQPPSEPNGNITGYLVVVALQFTAGCLYYIKIPCHGCDEAMSTSIYLNKPAVNLILLTSPIRVSSNEVDAPNVSAPCSLMVGNIISNSTDYNLQLLNLTSYRNYTATVQAVNERGLGDQASVTFQTDTSAPHDILDLTVYSVRDESTQQINLNIAWTPGDQTGPTDYYILVQESAGLGATAHNLNISPQTVTGYGSTTYVKSDVLAYWNYTVSVWAQTDKGNSSQKSAQNRTVENYPGAVQNLDVAQDATVANIVTLTFECPEIRSRNGSIEQFVIMQTLLDQLEQEDKMPDIIYNQSASDGQSEPCSSGYTVMARNIMVERNYSFSVMAVNNKYPGVVNNAPTFYVQPKVPHLVDPQVMFNVSTLVKQQDGSAIEFSKIHADVCSSCLTDTRWGTVKDVGILVCAKGANCTVSGRKKRSTTQQFTQIPSWGSAKLQYFKIEYRTTPNKWIPAMDGNNKYNPFIVGDNTSCSLAKPADYCNGPLPDGQEFYISIIMCTTAGCSVYREPYVFVTYAIKDDETNVGAIVGGVLGGLALIAVIGVIIFLVWHLRKRNEKQPRPHVVTTNENKELVKKRPVRMRDFNDLVTKFHRDTNLLFSAEFENIREVSETFKNTSDEAKREQNRVKNRYADILPYDHSRVKLETLADDDETNDFINANYIPGYNSVREYIATQGPMYSTMPDFWKMVWEQKCKMIVMLSDLMEAGKRKVDLYWPENLNEPITYGSVVVEMTNFSQLNKHIIRNFKLMKGDETRKVSHFFLPGWPDFGADIDFDVLLGFVKAVRREITPANQGPIVVHCSAGVGRSGTFMALDYFMQFVEKHNLEESVDVFDFVLQMRKNRTRMVQVETQYICIYDSVNKLIQSKIKSEEEKLYENISPGNGVYENFKPQEENIYANTTVKDDKYVYNNEAFEPEFIHSQKSDKPTTEL